MVFVRLVLGVCRAILARSGLQPRSKGNFWGDNSIGESAGDVENLRTGIAQSGITISTCRDLKLPQSAKDFRPGLGKLERLGQPLETMVEARDELRPAGELGLQGTTTGTYCGMTMGMCFGLLRQVTVGDESGEEAGDMSAESLW